jgi:preprotein translocase subunit SecY
MNKLELGKFLLILNLVLFLLGVAFIILSVVYIYNKFFKVKVEDAESKSGKISNYLSGNYNIASKNPFLIMFVVVIVVSLIFPLKNLFHRNYVLLKLQGVYDNGESYEYEDLDIIRFGEAENKESLKQSLYSAGSYFDGDLDYKSKYFTFKETYKFTDGHFENIFYYILEEVIFILTYVFLPVFLLSPLIYESELKEVQKIKK